jgi:hypothetical protein
MVCIYSTEHIRVKAYLTMLGSPPTRQVRGEFDSQDYPERKRRFTGRVWRSGDRYEGGYDSAVNLRVEVRDGVFGVTPENSREEMAGTTRLELATSAVTVPRGTMTLSDSCGQK